MNGKKIGAVLAQIVIFLVTTFVFSAIFTLAVFGLNELSKIFN